MLPLILFDLFEAWKLVVGSSRGDGCVKDLLLGDHLDNLEEKEL